jgi:hypothetical protein
MQIATGGSGFLNGVWVNIDGTIALETRGLAFPTAYYFGESSTFLGPLEAGVLSVSLPDSWRVMIDEFYIRWTTASPTVSTEDKPVIYLPTDGGGVTSDDVSGVANAQYGIRGDGAGGFEYFSAIGGVQQEAVAITWPETDLRNWVKVGVEHFAANGSRAAKVNFYLNESLVIARNWESGTNLPDFADAASGTGFMMRRMFRQGPNANYFDWTMARSRYGKFDIQGSEVG